MHIEIFPFAASALPLVCAWTGRPARQSGSTRASVFFMFWCGFAAQKLAQILYDALGLGQKVEADAKRGFKHARWSGRPGRRSKRDYSVEPTPVPLRGI